MNIYTILDAASKTYSGQPFTMQTDRDAKHQFTQATNDETTQFNQFPEDYSLILIGEYNPRTGKIKSIEHQVIARATEVKKEN